MVITLCCRLGEDLCDIDIQMHDGEEKNHQNGYQNRRGDRVQSYCNSMLFPSIADHQFPFGEWNMHVDSI